MKILQEMSKYDIYVWHIDDNMLEISAKLLAARE